MTFELNSKRTHDSFYKDEDQYKNPKEYFKKAASILLGEFNKNKVVKDYRMMVGFYDGMVDKILNPDPASDIAIVFRYMKLLDPNSA